MTWIVRWVDFYFSPVSDFDVLVILTLDSANIVSYFISNRDTSIEYKGMCVWYDLWIGLKVLSNEARMQIVLFYNCWQL